MIYIIDQECNIVVMIEPDRGTCRFVRSGGFLVLGILPRPFPVESNGYITNYLFKRKYIKFFDRRLRNVHFQLQILLCNLVQSFLRLQQILLQLCHYISLKQNYIYFIVGRVFTFLILK